MISDDVCLGIESTAHTLGIGIVKRKRILANERVTFPEPGIHPRKAADFQAENFNEILERALAKAHMTLDDIDIVAFSQGPGLGPCLRISCIAARAIGIRYKKPIVGVNHCVAHIEISKLLTNKKDPLVIYVSGGNTQIIIKRKRKYHVIGETLDIGIGNLLDVFAREIGERSARDVERLAKEATRYIPLPYTVKGMDLTFSGLLTECIARAKTEKKEDICYSLQENAYAMLCEAAERALALTKRKEVIVCGGVAQNKRLQEMIRTMADDWGVSFGVAPDEFNGDNGAMIAYVGCLLGRKKALNIKNCIPKPKFRTDEFEI